MEPTMVQDADEGAIRFRCCMGIMDHFHRADVEDALSCEPGSLAEVDVFEVREIVGVESSQFDKSISRYEHHGATDPVDGLNLCPTPIEESHRGDGARTEPSREMERRDELRPHRWEPAGCCLTSAIWVADCWGADRR